MVSLSSNWKLLLLANNFERVIRSPQPQLSELNNTLRSSAKKNKIVENDFPAGTFENQNKPLEYSFAPLSLTMDNFTLTSTPSDWFDSMCR